MIATSAMAADLPPVVVPATPAPPPAAAAFDWDGAYVGVHGGLSVFLECGFECRTFEGEDRSVTTLSTAISCLEPKPISAFGGAMEKARCT